MDLPVNVTAAVTPTVTSENKTAPATSVSGGGGDDVAGRGSDAGSGSASLDGVPKASATTQSSQDHPHVDVAAQDPAPSVVQGEATTTVASPSLSPGATVDPMAL